MVGFFYSHSKYITIDNDRPHSLVSGHKMLLCFLFYILFLVKEYESLLVELIGKD